MIRDILLLTVFPGAMVLAAACDLFAMRVPNRLVVVLTFGFFLMAPLAGLGWPDIGLHVGFALLALAIGFGLFA
ncbi:MAG: peptidase, partial [Methyloceanibacter sp.]